MPARPRILARSLSRTTVTSRRRTYTRRALIAAGALTVGCVAVGTGSYIAVQRANEPISTIGDVDFETALAIPPLLDPEPGEDGRKRFDLALQSGSTQIVPGGEAKTWGVNSRSEYSAAT